MQLHTWLLFTVMETSLCLTPGPAVLLVLSQGLSRGGLASIWSSAGILGANALYFILSGTGLGAILIASYGVFSAIKWIGAAYLIWIGLSVFFGKSAVLSVSTNPSSQHSRGKMIANGFILQASKPTLLVYFTALLPQFIDRRGPFAYQVAILGLTSIAIEFVVLAGYGALAGRLTAIATWPRFAKITNRVSGSMLIAAGFGIARIRRAQ
jgi:threonine/homoserine/homoserine lactone efflux protein